MSDDEYEGPDVNALDADMEEEDEDEDELEKEEKKTKDDRPKRVPSKNRRFTGRFSSYEWSRVIATRAEQINAGSVVARTTLWDSVQIAEAELSEKRCPLFIDRPSGDGTRVERWHTKDLVPIDHGSGYMKKSPIQEIGDLSLDQILTYGSSFSNLTPFKPFE